MTHTVCQPCYDCKYTDCAACPVECFYHAHELMGSKHLNLDNQ